jgi:hypothetical protein
VNADAEPPQRHSRALGRGEFFITAGQVVGEILQLSDKSVYRLATAKKIRRGIEETAAR